MAKKRGPEITVFFSPGLRKDPCGRLSAALMERAAELFLSYHGIRFAALSLVFVTGSVIRKINKTHLGHDDVTDIITFDLRERGALFLDGELFICPSQARRNARACGDAIECEILRYVAHGILHLLGYDDTADKQRMIMRRKEDALLSLVYKSDPFGRPKIRGA